MKKKIGATVLALKLGKREGAEGEQKLTYFSNHEDDIKS